MKASLRNAFLKVPPGGTPRGLPAGLPAGLSAGLHGGMPFRKPRKASGLIRARLVEALFRKSSLWDAMFREALWEGMGHLAALLGKIWPFRGKGAFPRLEFALDVSVSDKTASVAGVRLVLSEALRS